MIFTGDGVSDIFIFSIFLNFIYNKARNEITSQAIRL